MVLQYKPCAEDEIDVAAARKMKDGRRLTTIEHAYRHRDARDEPGATFVKPKIYKYGESHTVPGSLGHE